MAFTQPAQLLRQQMARVGARALSAPAWSSSSSSSSSSFLAAAARSSAPSSASASARTLHASSSQSATSSHEVQSMRSSPSQAQRPNASSHPSQSQEPIRPEGVYSISQRALASQQRQQQQQQPTAEPISASTASPLDVPTQRTSVVPTLGYTKDNLPTKTDPTLAFFVGILMRDGKKAASSRTVMNVLAHLNEWTSSPPLPLFVEAINRASPLVRMQSSKSGGKITQIPIPLNPRQSTHRGIKAIIEASKKRSDRYISTRIAREMVAVLEGSSSVLSRKEEQHKVAMANRANASVRI
ncbi:hypothetical protein OC842_003934 [Tilletia horrida]|uniref:Small ribosomal subunit protein uS7 domain-containing protein n=1 Tax=Tilletia horrida TaxID=155126 RepID=A0AAN6GAU7_9BASI|nr:hypothetical protein OC842_003934 [Tilletia horrida]